MDHWFSVIASGCELPVNTVQELDDVGFVVIRGPVAPSQLSRLAAVYDAAVSTADPADVGGGRTTTRVWDFVIALQTSMASTSISQSWRRVAASSVHRSTSAQCTHER
jgi:hypothetical protein